MNPNPAIRVQAACARLIDAGRTVTFTAVAARTGIANAAINSRPNCARSSQADDLHAFGPADSPWDGPTEVMSLFRRGR